MYAVDVVRDLNKGLKADKACLQVEVDELLELLYKKRVTDEHKAEQITAKAERVQPVDTLDMEVG